MMKAWKSSKEVEAGREKEHLNDHTLSKRGTKKKDNCKR
jgi:hypothetical protein